MFYQPNKYRLLIRGLALAICIFVMMPCQGQLIGDYSVTNYTDENGLPQNSVNAIARDSKGFLWLATEAGLVRFDGQSFFTYDKTIFGISENRVRHFLPPAGKPGTSEPLFYTQVQSYIGIYSDSYARSVNSYPDMDVREAVKYKLKGINVEHITSLPWIFNKPDLDTLKLPDVGIMPLGKNAYYFRHNGNIEYYIGQQLQFRVYVPYNRELLFSNGKLFAAQKNGDLIKIEKKGTSTLKLSGDILNNKCYKKCKATYLWNNISQQTFIHLNGSLYQVELNNSKYAHTILLFTGIDFDQHGVIAIYVDELDTIFLGCQTEGLYVLRKKRFKVASAPKSAVSSAFYAIAPSGDNSLITYQGYEVDLSSNSPSIKMNKKESALPWPWHFLAKDQAANLWVAEYTSPIDRRLGKYSADGKRLLKNWKLPGAVGAIYCDRLGGVWSETDNSNLYYLSSAQSNHGVPRFVTKTGFGGINCFYRAGGRQLWLGTPTGLCLLDIPTRKIAQIALSGRNIRHIYGSGDELWICTYGDGMYLYKQKKITHFPIDDGKYLAFVHCIVPDKKNQFWISTNKGLFVANKADLLNFANNADHPPYFHYFDKSNGFKINEFNGGCQPCGTKLSSGKIAFPSMNGIVYFSPENLRIEFPEKTILVSDVIADGKSLKFRKSVSVERNFEQIQVTVSTPYFGQKKNIQFSYSVSGPNQTGSWIPLTELNRIYLTSLLPGRYLLNVRKSNGFNAKNFSYASLEIIVPPYWYETWWFMAIVMLAATILIYFFFKQRAEYIRKENYNQNLLDKARLYGDIVASINHDIQTPMHYAIYSVEYVVKFLSSAKNSDARALDTCQEALASLRRIKTLTDNLLNYLKVNFYSNNYAIIPTNFEVSPLVSEIVEMFSAKIKRDKIQVLNLVPDRVEFMQSRPIFSVVLHNLIDNGLKVSKNGVITISTFEQVGQKQLLIHDSGSGVPPELASWLMDPKEKWRPTEISRADPQLPVTGGLGLVIVKDLCRLSGIKLLVEASDKGGTVISLIIDERGPIQKLRNMTSQ